MPERLVDRYRGARPGGRSQRIRQSVLAAAQKILLESGYEAMTIASVARESGVNPSSIYRRWEDKEGLTLDAVLDLIGARIPVPDTGSLRDDLVKLFGDIVEAFADPGIAGLARWLASMPQHKMREERRIYWEARFGVTATVLERAYERGELSDPIDAPALAERIGGPIWMRLLVTNRPLDRDLVEDLVDDALLLVKAGKLKKTKP